MKMVIGQKEQIMIIKQELKHLITEKVDGQMQKQKQTMEKEIKR